MKKIISTLFVLLAVAMFGTTALATSPEEAVADSSSLYVDEFGNQQVHLPRFYLDDIFQTELTWDDPLAYRMSEQQEAVQEKYSNKLLDHAKALLKLGAKVKSNFSQNESSGNHQLNITIYLEEEKQFMPIHGSLPRASELNMRDSCFEYDVQVTPFSIDLQIGLPF